MDEKKLSRIFKLTLKIVFHGTFLCSLFNLGSSWYALAVCSGCSMEPTIHEDDIVFVKKIEKYDIKKGDVVVLRSPDDPHKLICKRVVGLPGDKVTTDNDCDILPLGRMWVEGDNEDSTDSRSYGPVPKGLIYGKVLTVLWPHFKNFNSPKKMQ